MGAPMKGQAMRNKRAARQHSPSKEILAKIDTAIMEWVRLAVKLPDDKRTLEVILKQIDFLKQHVSDLDSMRRYLANTSSHPGVIPNERCKAIPGVKIAGYWQKRGVL